MTKLITKKKVPVIFVVHSMGGLVVKKVSRDTHSQSFSNLTGYLPSHAQAYILGSQDFQFQSILNAVCSIVFLATPHRGSSLADTLNKLLNISLQSPKQYVSDLQKSSARIVDINDQFRFYADKVQIVSFFETQPTSVGIKKSVRTSAAALQPSPPLPKNMRKALNAVHERHANAEMSIRLSSKGIRQFWTTQMRYPHR